MALQRKTKDKLDRLIDWLKQGKEKEEGKYSGEYSTILSMAEKLRECAGIAELRAGMLDIISWLDEEISESFDARLNIGEEADAALVERSSDVSSYEEKIEKNAALESSWNAKHDSEMEYDKIKKECEKFYEAIQLKKEARSEH